MVAPFGSPLFFCHHHMIPTHFQTRIRLIIISVVKTTLSRVRLDQRQQGRFLAVINGKHAHDAVALEYAEHQRFAGSAPAAFALAMPAKAGLVAFDGAIKRLLAAFRVPSSGESAERNARSPRSKPGREKAAGAPFGSKPARQRQNIPTACTCSLRSSGNSAIRCENSDANHNGGICCVHRPVAKTNDSHSFCNTFSYPHLTRV